MSRPATPARGARRTGAASHEVSAEAIELGAAQTGKSQVMRVLADLREGDRRLTRWAASWRSGCVRRVLPAAEESAEHTKLWCGAAAALSVTGWRGRRAATAGLWIAHEEVHDRPDSLSFPSGHTAAAGAFSAAVAAAWPWAGAVCGAGRPGGRRTRAHGRPPPLRRRRRRRDRPGRSRLGALCSAPGGALAAMTATSHRNRRSAGWRTRIRVPGPGEAGVGRPTAQVVACIQATAVTGS